MGAAIPFARLLTASAAGIATETTHGTKRVYIILPAVTLPRIQSMIVVTSPMGDHAPPLLAAMTISEA